MPKMVLKFYQVDPKSAQGLQVVELHYSCHLSGYKICWIGKDTKYQNYVKEKVDQRAFMSFEYTLSKTFVVFKHASWIRKTILCTFQIIFFEKRHYLAILF